jgi:hypothetical protein
VTLLRTLARAAFLLSLLSGIGVVAAAGVGNAVGRTFVFLVSCPPRNFIAINDFPSGLRIMFAPPRLIHAYDWLSGTNQVIYQASEGGPSSLYIANIPHRTITTITETGYQPRWSPDAII